MLGPSSDDDGISLLSGVQNDTLRKLQDVLAINQLELVRIEAAFITAAQKRFEEPVIERIGSFLSNLDNGFRAIRKAGNLFGQQLVPKLPAQPLRKQLSDLAPTASVLPFDCDDFNHVDSL
jgi:hypothetical protein